MTDDRPLGVERLVREGPLDLEGDLEIQRKVLESELTEGGIVYLPRNLPHAGIEGMFRHAGSAGPGVILRTQATPSTTTLTTTTC